jgi:hypothetical protein
MKKPDVRVRDITRAGPATPPVVVWRCASPKAHLLLRVFLSEQGWRVLGESFRIALPEWLERSGIAEHVTVDEYREKRAVVSNARRVDGIDQPLPMDIATWPRHEQFEIGCACGHVMVEVEELAADCRHARDTGKPQARKMAVT